MMSKKIKLKFHAQVRLTILRQVEFEADGTHSLAELQQMAKELAEAEYGDADIVEVEDIEQASIYPLYF